MQKKLELSRSSDRLFYDDFFFYLCSAAVMETHLQKFILYVVNEF